MHDRGIRSSLCRLAPLLLGLFLLWPAGGRADGHEEGLNVLFIGNSFTRFHQLHRMVRKLAENDPGAPRVRTTVETLPGGTLRRHWIGRRAVAEIRRGRYTHVVLQDHSLRPIDRPEEMARYARRFAAEIDRSGAQTVFYATWARRAGTRFYRERPDLDPATMQARIDAAYGALAQRLEADVAPVGDAFLEAEGVLPDDVALRGRDGFHPTLAGSYLAACVLYRTLTRRSPEGNPWYPWGLDEDVARTLQRLAR